MAKLAREIAPIYHSDALADIRFVSHKQNDRFASAQ